MTVGDTIYQANITAVGEAEVRGYVITQVRRDGTIRIRASGGRSSVPFAGTNLSPTLFRATPEAALVALWEKLEDDTAEARERIRRNAQDLLAISRHPDAPPDAPPPVAPKICPVCVGQARAARKPARTWACRSCGGHLREVQDVTGAHAETTTGKQP